MHLSKSFIFSLHHVGLARPTPLQRKDPCKAVSSAHGKEPTTYCRLIRNVAAYARNMKPYAEDIQDMIRPVLSENCEHYNATESSFIDISLCEPTSTCLQEMLASMWTLMYDLRDVFDYVYVTDLRADNRHHFFTNLRNLFGDLDKEWEHSVCHLNGGIKPTPQPRSYTVPEVMQLCHDHDLLRAYIVAKDFARTADCLGRLGTLSGFFCARDSNI